MSGLYLNYCFCEISDDEEAVFSIDFNDKIDLRELRKSYPDTIFHRDGKKVFCWKADGSVFKLKEFTVSEELISKTSTPSIISKMIECKVKDLFGVEHYYVYHERYSHNLVAKKKKPEYEDDALVIKKCAKINTYFFKNNEKSYFGFSLSQDLKYEFKWSKTEFKINNITSSDLIENRQGKVAANKRAIQRYFETKGLIGQIECVRDSIILEKQFDFISKTITSLRNSLKSKSIYKNIIITDTTINYLPYADRLKNEVIPAPKKYFANDSTAIPMEWPSSTLERVGPYSNYLSGQKFKISLIASKENEGTLNYFTKLLSSKIKSMFKIDLDINYYWTKDFSISELEKSIASINASNTNLGLVITTTKDFSLKPSVSPYFTCKAQLMGQEIPSQYICIDTIKKIKDSNDLILGNISLNIYGKLGGTAWGIEKAETTKKEFIIGIGSTKNTNQETITSIANVFEFHGAYIAGSCNPAIDGKAYKENLEEFVKELVSKVVENEKEVHLIFHIYKSAGRRTEIAALENVVKGFQNIKITYAFVHVSDGHNFRMFYDDGKLNDKRKSKLAKGNYIRISALESLVMISDDGSLPLRVSIDKRSSLQDIYYISKQVFHFAHLSARSFKIARKPITIIYPSLMAGLIEKMKLISGWNPNKLSVKGVTEKLWFL